MDVEVVEVRDSTDAYTELLDVACQLNQAKYIPVREHHIDESILLGAFFHQRCVGFLRFLIQVIGSDQGRSPIISAGQPLREGYVEAFGVLPEHRRQRIGQQMQEHAIKLCQVRTCYQIRSRSPITSYENYALKLKMGYAIHPSHENDSYYFIKVLTQP
jgi:ribosomal protein S18 acetylase RimI-like enzyme